MESSKSAYVDVGAGGSLKDSYVVRRGMVGVCVERRMVVVLLILSFVEKEECTLMTREMWMQLIVRPANFLRTDGRWREDC